MKRRKKVSITVTRRRVVRVEVPAEGDEKLKTEAAVKANEQAPQRGAIRQPPGA